MGISAGITIYFLDTENKIILHDSMDCYNFNNNDEIFKIPTNAVKISICYGTEYESCKCDYCYQLNESSEGEYEEEETENESETPKDS